MHIPATARYMTEIKVKTLKLGAADVYPDLVLPFLTMQVISRLMSETSSGSFCSNDSVLQSLMVALPFGGVGKSVQIIPNTVVEYYLQYINIFNTLFFF